MIPISLVTVAMSYKLCSFFVGQDSYSVLKTATTVIGLLLLFAIVYEII